MTNRATSELTCRELVELITEYLEGALPPGEHARVEQHLAYCDGCAGYLLQMRGAIRASRSTTEVGLTPQLEQALLEAFRGWRKI